MKLFTKAAAIALMAALAFTPAFATYQEPTPLPIPEIDLGGDDNTAAIILGIGILGVILFSLMDDEPPTANCPTISNPDAMTGGKGEVPSSTVACE